MQVLPIAHASGDRRKIRIVNPQAVDLKTYVVKVERAVEKITKYVHVYLHFEG